MFSADWALKRLLKFVIKKSVGRFLKGCDLDLQQLDVQLGTGTLELRDVLLNCDELNKELVRGQARPRGLAQSAATPMFTHAGSHDVACTCASPATSKAACEASCQALMLVQTAACQPCAACMCLGPIRPCRH
jgi:hypothetical protein